MANGRDILKNGEVLTPEELRLFVEKAKSGRDNTEAVIGVITNEIVEQIKNMSGEIVSKIRVDSEHIRHSYNKISHKLEAGDIFHIIDVINKPDTMALSSEQNHGSKVLLFKADINGELFFVMGIHKKDNGYLSLITAYRGKKAGRDSTGKNPRAYVQNGAPTADALLSS
jgi:hypothetical protein